MQAGGGAFYRPFQKKGAAGLQSRDDLKPLLGGEPLRHNAHAVQLPVDGVHGDGVGGVAEFFRCGPVLLDLGLMGAGLGKHVSDEQVRVAQPQDPVADVPVAAVVKIDAQHADEPSVLLDEHGVGAQVLAVGGDAVILETVIRGLVTPVPQDAQRHVGQGRADLPAADVIVGNGDDGAVLVGQVVEGDLIIRAQRVA